jgi:lipoprotein-releasing system permease protein
VNFPFYIAKRYLVAKKSHNVINIIASISLAGIAVGTMALIVILSVFNGFDNVVKSLINSFNPDIKVILVEGKTFVADETILERIKSIKGIAAVATVLEDKALLRYDERQTIAIVKGVSEDYADVSGIDSMITEGEFILNSRDQSFAIIGKGIDIFLNVILNSPRQMGVYVPKRSGKVSFDPEKAVNRKFLNVSGVFLIEQDYDSKYIIVPLAFAQDLFEYP